MSLPKFYTADQSLSLLQTNWTAILDPVVANPIVKGIFLKDQHLLSGANVLNHRLGRRIQGWIVTDRNGAASIYRSQPLNDLTLTLTVSADVTVTLYVF